MFSISFETLTKGPKIGEGGFVDYTNRKIVWKILDAIELCCIRVA